MARDRLRLSMPKDCIRCVGWALPLKGCLEKGVGVGGEVKDTKGGSTQSGLTSRVRGWEEYEQG